MPTADATQILLSAHRGDRRAADVLMPLVYDKLRGLAGRLMREERHGHTLDPTALVNEAYLQLVKIDRVDWQGKSHFYAMAARQMRRVLINHAKMHGAKKRRDEKLTLHTGDARADVPHVEFAALHEALDVLAQKSERQARVAELRFFAGMQCKEIAQALGVAERTVRNDWLVARAWLARRLQ